jgi:hypothetical protein
MNSARIEQPSDGHLDARLHLQDRDGGTLSSESTELPLLRGKLRSVDCRLLGKRMNQGSRRARERSRPDKVNRPKTIETLNIETIPRVIVIVRYRGFPRPEISVKNAQTKLTRRDT